MPRVDFRGRRDQSECHSAIPVGTYRARLIDVQEGLTKRGDPLWKLDFAITDGPHAGRHVLDRLAFSEAALGRVALFCEALGIEATDEVDLRPELVQGCECEIAVIHRSYVDRRGRDRVGNEIPWAGFKCCDSGTAGPNEYETGARGDDTTSEDDDIPF